MRYGYRRTKLTRLDIDGFVDDDVMADDDVDDLSHQGGDVLHRSSDESRSSSSTSHRLREPWEGGPATAAVRPAAQRSET